jgi:alpha-galactosidase
MPATLLPHPPPLVTRLLGHQLPMRATQVRRTAHVLLVLAGLLAAGACLGANDAATTTAPVKVFILAGQSNMEGKAKLSLLDVQVNAPETRDIFAHLRTQGHYIVCDHVWINFLDGHGMLTVGYGSPGAFGPELEFGIVMGERFSQPVLLIKTAWGGKSLGRDFRPPSAGLPTPERLQQELTEANARLRAHPDPQHPGPLTLEDIPRPYGQSYRDMIAEVRTVLRDLPARFPDYHGQGYDIAGLVWFQGWNDLFTPDFVSSYAATLTHLIHDVRSEFGVPRMPVVIGQMGQDGLKATGTLVQIKAAQAAVAERPEFAGTVALVRTDVFWDAKAAALVNTWEQHKAEWDKVGSDYGYHYLGSALTYANIGMAFGQAMSALIPR